MDTIDLFDWLYVNEVNFEMKTIWDGGYFIKLGDEMNGFKEEGGGDTFEEAVEDLKRMVKNHYPEVETE